MFDTAFDERDGLLVVTFDNWFEMALKNKHPFLIDMSALGGGGLLNRGISMKKNVFFFTFVRYPSNLADIFVESIYYLCPPNMNMIAHYCTLIGLISGRIENVRNVMIYKESNN